MNIEEDLIYLALKRKQLEARREAESSLIRGLETTPEYLALEAVKKEIAHINDDIGRVEIEIRNNALEESKLSNYEKRKLYGVIQIKEFSVVRVVDEEKAKSWASQNATSLLSLNMSKFSKAVKELDLDFIEKDTEYRAQIASDLGEYNKEG